MKVEAYKQGFLGSRLVEEGELFELQDIKYKNAEGKDCVSTAQDQFSDSWMIDLSDDAPASKKSSKKPASKNDPDDAAPDSGGNVI